MMIFEGDYVRLTSEHVFLRVEEVLADDIVRLEDGFNVLASSMFIQEVKSADEYAAFEDPILAVTDANYGTIPTGYDLVMALVHDNPFMDGVVLYGWDEVTQINAELAGGEADATVLYYVKGSIMDDMAREQLDVMEVA
tara:strand:+ start:725 stop:1141 length:417 start_codon:yes stop_codon:yes gene_type:complete